MLIINNAGCLEPYARMAVLFDKENVSRLISYANSIDGFLCNYQIPFMYAFSTFQKGQMAEIGCWQGRTTNIIKVANRKLDLVCVDTFRGSEEHKEYLEKNKITNFKSIFEKNLVDRQNYSNVKVIEDTSANASKLFYNETFDVIWIDAAHDYENVKLDINSWYPKLKKGGIMLGHDYPDPKDPNGGFEELTKAVNEEVRDAKDFTDFGYFCGIWGARKV